jgi:hypothetical protein
MSVASTATSTRCSRAMSAVDLSITRTHRARSQRAVNGIGVDGIDRVIGVGSVCAGGRGTL